MVWGPLPPMLRESSVPPSCVGKLLSGMASSAVAPGAMPPAVVDSCWLPSETVRLGAAKVSLLSFVIRAVMV